MRIVVTGGTGFVGRPLVKRLLELGHEVSVVSRSPERAKESLCLETAWSWENLEECFAGGVDAVIHLAGETVQGRWSAKKETEVWESRIRTTTQIAEAIEAAEVPPKVWISASGIGFYGEGGERELQEQDAAGDDYFARLCVKWENIALSTARSGRRVVCTRFGIILGEGGGALKAMMLPTKSGIGGPLGSGKQWWSWISLEDVVGALVHVLEHDGVSGPVNVVAPTPMRQGEFQKLLSRALHRPSWIPAPAFGVRLLLGRFADEVLSSKRVMPTVLTETGFEWSMPTLKEVFDALYGGKSVGIVLPLVGAFALMGAPYGKTPHLVDIANELAGSSASVEVVGHAGMHLALVPWLLFALYCR